MSCAGSELSHESQAVGVISYNDENVVSHIAGDSPVWGDGDVKSVERSLP